MRVVAIAITILAGFAPLAYADDEATYRSCLAAKERYMGVTGADAWCRNEIEAARRPTSNVVRQDLMMTEEKAYELCVLDTRRTLSGIMAAEQYCERRRQDQRRRREILGR